MYDSSFWFPMGITLAIVLIVSFGFGRFYRHKTKVDQGFKVVYFGLSYRRKFWRTIYTSPLLVIYIGLIYLLEGMGALFIGFVLIGSLVFIIQASYNYVKWQKEEKFV